MKYVIFDLDGCVSDDRHRRSYLEAKEYDRYHAACDRDEAYKLSKQIVQNHALDQSIILLFLTGRPYKYTQQTRSWIQQKLGLIHKQNYELIMRPRGNFLPSPEMKIAELKLHGISPDKVAVAYDDRQDILAAYAEYGITWLYQLDEYGRTIYVNHKLGSLANSALEKKPRDAADCLADGIALFRERNGVYKDNHKRFGEVMAALYPDGLSLKGAEEFTQFGLFVQSISKMTRHAASENGHMDSVRDLKVYAAMLEAYMEGSGHDD